jgi:hypothetical protein
VSSSLTSLPVDKVTFLLDAYQRLAMARNNEQPPGSLRLARRQPPPSITTKPVAQTKSINLF